MVGLIAQTLLTPIARLLLRESDALTRLNRCSENVVVLAIVVAERELGNVERQVFRANFMECSHHAALEDRPEAFDGIRMNGAVDVLTASVIDGLVREAAARIAATDQTVCGPLIGADQRDATRHSFAHEVEQRNRVNGFDHASDDVAFALHRADYWRLTGTDAAAAALAAAPLVFVLVLEVAADECLVNFNDAEQ